MTGLLRMRKVASALLLVGILMMLTTVAATAAKGPRTPFAAEGAFLSINEGEVRPAGNSGRFVVKDRTISGILFGPSLVGPFDFTYGTNVPIATQSGQIHGTLAVGEYVAKVHASSSIGLTPVPCDPASSPPGTCIPDPASPYGGWVPGLLIEGTLTFTDGTAGHGDLAGWVIPMIDPDTGHIIGIIAGGIGVSGQWHQ